jgi:putative MATE family efflux protein
MPHDARSRMMEDEQIPTLLTKFAIPAIVSMLIAAVYNVVDTLFVGRLGTEAIGATSIAFPLFMLFSTFGLSVGIGAASYISRMLGAKDAEQAHRAGTTAIVTTIGLALILSTLGLLALNPLLRAFGATATILPYARDYTGILVGGAIFTMCNMCMNNMLRAEGSVKMSMLGISAGAIINIALDPICIFTLGLGVKGAAIATVVAQAISTLILASYYLRRKSVLIIHPRYFTPSRQMYGEIVKMGIPTIVRQGLVSVSMGFFNVVAGAYGDAAIAAMGVVVRVSMPGVMTLFGFGQGFQPIAGYNYGAKRYDRLLEAIRVSITRASLFCLALTALMMGLAGPIIRAFSSDPDVIAIGVRGLRYFALIFPMFGFNIIVHTLFMALGRAIPAGILAFSRQGIFLIPAIAVLPRWFGLTGLLLCQPVADFATTALTLALAGATLRDIRRLRDTMPTPTPVPAAAPPTQVQPEYAVSTDGSMTGLDL